MICVLCLFCVLDDKVIICGLCFVFVFCVLDDKVILGDLRSQSLIVPSRCLTQKQEILGKN